LATCVPALCRAAENKNVQIIGANCTLGPQSLLPILQELAGVDDLRISGMPNAGFPKREGDRIVYPNPHRSISLSSLAKPPRSVCAFSEVAAAQRRRTSAPWPKR